jgi:hypothetical protein
MLFVVNAITGFLNIIEECEARSLDFWDNWIWCCMTLSCEVAT